MGQTYTVELSLEIKNEPELVKRSNEFFKAEGMTLDKFVNNTTVDEVLNSVFPHLHKHSKGFYYADFDASYSWENEMYQWFRVVAPTLKQGSSIEVWPDSGSWKLVVTASGKIVETEEDEDDDIEEQFTEGAEGKRDPGFEYVIYDCTDERLGQCPVVALRSTRTEAEYATNRLTGRMYGKTGPKKFRGKELTFEKVPKGRFKVGDNFYGPFDQDYNKLESLKEETEVTKNGFDNLKVGDTIVDPRGKEYKVTRVGYRHHNFNWAANKPYSDPKTEMTITAVGGNHTLNDFPLSEFKGWRVKDKKSVRKIKK